MSISINDLIAQSVSEYEFSFDEYISDRQDRNNDTDFWTGCPTHITCDTFAMGIALMQFVCLYWF